MRAISPAVDRISAIPMLGSGLGYRRELRAAILESRDTIDFLEVITEQFMGHPRQLGELEELCAAFPVIPHGIGLSIGSAMLDDDYLSAIKRVSDLTGSPYYSEHLAMTRAPGIDIGHLSPLWFTERALQITIDNVRRLQDLLDKPLILENVTYLLEIPGADMPQPEFFARLVERTGCGVLLDLTNVYINSVNHHFDPVEFVKAMPLDRIVQIHLAGGYMHNGVLIDGHSEPVDEGSWHLLETLTSLTTIKGSILEHDANFPEQIATLLDQVGRARAVMSRGSAGRDRTNS